MYKMTIWIHGDNRWIHEKELKLAVKAIEQLPTVNVHRAELERDEDPLLPSNRRQWDL